MLNLERLQALNSWLKSTSIKLTQVNGQRKYGGPPEAWLGPTPGAFCEVFINHIPRDTYEDQLIPLFSSVGPLWEFRLMMNFSGQNRGFAYAKYGSACDANKAVRQLNGHVLEPGCYLSVCRSTEKRHLCIGNLPAATKHGELLKVLRGLTEGVQEVALLLEPEVGGASAAVSFSSHDAATMAKRVLVEAFKKRYAVTVSVKWLTQDKLLPPATPPQSLLPHHTVSAGSKVTPNARFCREVGGPSGLHCPPSQGNAAAAAYPASPVLVLQKMCQVMAAGQPLYQLNYSHTGSDGFLYFTYDLSVQGTNVAFKGLVMILPRPTYSQVLEEARQAAAQQVLQALSRQLVAE